MEFGWTEEEDALRRRAASVAESAGQRYGRFTDSWMNGYSREFSAELGRLGWIGMSWPKELGGGGWPAIHRFIVAEELIKGGAPIAASWFADRQIGPCLIAYGTKQQQLRYLPEILAGQVTWCIGMSEPGAGSDLASLRTSARREGANWIINGHKIWTSFAAVADYCYLICRTRTGGRPHEGISELIVPMNSPGIEVRPIRDMTGGKHFCEVFFDEVSVAAENLVGTEGAAFKQTMRQLEHERGGVDRLVSNYALLTLAAARADKADAALMDTLARLFIEYRIGRQMVIRESLRQAPPGYSALTKAFCTEHEQDVASFVWRALGAEALIDDSVTRGLLYAPSYTIMGGTSQVLRNVIAERLLDLPREPRR